MFEEIIASGVGVVESEPQEFRIEHWTDAFIVGLSFPEAGDHGDSRICRSQSPYIVSELVKPSYRLAVSLRPGTGYRWPPYPRPEFL